MDIKSLLRSSSYWTLNKDLVYELGLETAFVLVNLLEADSVVDKEDGWFYQTVETLEGITGLSEYKQNKALNELIKRGLVLKETRGMPAKRYFKICEESILELTLKNLGTGPKKLRNLTQKTSDNKYNNNKASNNKENTSSKEGAPPKQKSLVSKTSKAEAKAKRIKTMAGMIDAFTANDNVRKALKDYFRFRLGRGLQVNQWELILRDLREYAKDDAVLAVEKIEGAIAGGYMQIIAPWEKGKTAAKKNYKQFDNTSGRKVESAKSMSKQEFEATLAKDKDGNPIVF